MPIFTLEATGAISILNVFRLNTSDVCAVMCYNDVRVSYRDNMGESKEHIMLALLL